MALNRALAHLAGIAATVLTAGLLTAPVAQAAPPSYVALGDSYSSGTGTRSYIDDGTSCKRSTAAFPSLIATARGYALNFRACGGAKIPDVTNTQLSALSAATNYVSISVGGNDAGFADVITECALPGWASNCDGKINTAQAYIANTLPGALGTLYASIRSKAPNAKVVVVGYPRIFMGEDCSALTWFSPAEQTRLNQTADQLNARLAAAAAARGFSFANPTSRFIGHAVCDSPAWLTNLSVPVGESFHPNVAGHSSGYTPAVSGLLTGATVTADATLLATAATQAESLARTQRHYAEADRSIEPKEFVVPDLTTPAMRKAARKAGVDLDEFLAER
ncbi:SGNH/GDSL hydrolase family protein [Nocardioides campestrisoli]|uniref:SGNH/GDSL hydrolase family protein n=1 Tax=Nocardioides campestrisoli TaxID=2736757 RepID=UPI0015E73407|nr:SGNH/GDSL hydrolase family protein [Nocardioides campestrisoli]